MGGSYYFRHYRNDNGLSNNTVMSCLQDQRGFIWFGTRKVSPDLTDSNLRFSFTTPRFPTRFEQFHHGNMRRWKRMDLDWNPEGICYYVPDNDCFGTIVSENPNFREIVYDVKADNNNCIWIATPSATFRYNKESKKLSSYPASEYFSRETSI